MAKRPRGSTRSKEKKLRLKETKFLDKYGYSTDQDSLFQNYRRHKSKIENNLKEWDWEELDFYYTDDDF